MKLLDCTVYAGPNVVAPRPCASLRVAVAQTENTGITPAMCANASRLLAALAARLTHPPRTAIPALEANTATGFVVAVALALQQSLHCPVRWARATQLDAQTHELAFELMRLPAAEEIAACALTLLEVVRAAASPDALQAAFARMHAAMGLRLRHFVMYHRQLTATRLGIEHVTGFGMHYTHLRLGHGMHTRLLAPGYTNKTAHLARGVAGDKNETYNCLLARKLPVARQYLAGSAAEALVAARRIGFPVVVKPMRGNRGRAVAVNLGDEAAVAQAFHNAQTVHQLVVVEKYLLGVDYRLLVVNGAFVAGLCRPPPTVTGDGVTPVAALIEQTNRDVSRDDIFLNRITVDAEVLRTLAAQGLDLDAVPAAGQAVLIRRAATPESAVIDVTAKVHPDNRAAAIAAAEACGLDVAGIDMMSQDIAVSWRDNQAGIVEVNAGPGVDMHMYPQSGTPRDVSFHMIRSIVPARTAGRIPTVLVTGRKDKRLTAQWITNLLALAGFHPGLVDHHADAPRTQHHETETAARVAALLDDRSLGAGVFDISLRVLAEEGVPLGYPAVSVLTDDLAPDWGRDVPADLLVRTQALALDVACGAVIINGRQAGLRELAAHRPAWQVGYIWPGEDAAPQSDITPLEAHLSAGGWCVTETQDAAAGQRWIELRQAARRQLLLRLDTDLGGDGRRFAPREALFACAVLLAIGTTPEALAQALPAAAHKGEQGSTLTADPFAYAAEPTGRVASCDPRDAPGLERLARLTGIDKAAGGNLWAVVNADPWSLAETALPLRLLASARTRWCCVGPERVALHRRLHETGIAAEQLGSFSTLAQARARLLAEARPGDTVALLDMDASARLLWCPLTTVRRPPPLTHHPHRAAWQAATLAQHFAGAWVSGPTAGWGVDEFVVDTDAHAKPAGKLVLVPGEPDQADTFPEIERRIHQAFARGAAAVVAPLLPADLPRWQRLMVCDDVELGMARLLHATGNGPS